MEIKELINQMTLEEKADFFCGSAEDCMCTAGCERLGIQPQRFTDGPIGVRPDKNAVAFPCETSMAATWNKQLIEEIGSALADECIRGGRDMILGPGVNIKRTPLCGRNFEYFSEDPCLSGKIAGAYIKGIQAKNVGACVKHFAANNQETDRSFVSADIDERTMRELYLKSFEIAVREGKPSAVMTAYNRINGFKCSESPLLLKKILRDEWGFDGIVMSDWIEVKKGLTSLKSGLNLTMPFDLKIKNDILNGVKTGSLSEELLNDAIEKLIRFSKRNKPVKAHYDRAVQHKVAKKAAAEGIVLLKNENDILPITSNKYKKIVIIGEYAKNPVYCGNGSAKVFPDTENIDSAVDSLKNICGDKIEIDYMEGYLSNRTPQDNIFAFSPSSDNDEGRRIANADLVIMFVGNQFNVETEDADRVGATLDTYYYSYINRVLCLNKNLVLILQTGSAVIPHLWDKRAKAIIEMWYAGEAGCSALADILCGNVNPSGKLPETFSAKIRTDIDYPGDGYKVCYNEKWAVGYRYYDLYPQDIAFPFGFGMSYTDFEYKNALIKDNCSNLVIEFDIKNIGNYAGKEAAQIYFSHEESFVSNPKKQLVEFVKTKELRPGESEHIAVAVKKRDLAYYSINLGEYFIEPGVYEFLIGASSRDIRLKTKYTHPNANDYNFELNSFTIVG